MMIGRGRRFRAGTITPVLGRGGAVYRTRGSNAIRAAKTLYAAAKKLAPYARAAGAKSTLARKISPGNSRRSSGRNTPKTIARRITTTQRSIQNALAVRGGVKKYRAGFTSGKYVGKVNLNLKNKGVTKYDMQGSVHENEVYGNNIMANCNYIGFANPRPYEIGKSIGMALCRYLMNKFYGVDYANVNETIWPSGSLALKPANFIFGWEQTLGTTTNYGSITFAVNNATTVLIFGNWFSQNVFLNANFGSFGAGASRIFKYVQIQDHDAIDATPTSVVSTTKQIFMDKVELECYGISNVTLQNSTVSDTSSASTDVIDSNPLSGKIYMFNSLAPVQSQISQYNNGTPASYWDDLQETNTSSIVLPATDPPAQWRSPPKPAMFDRLKGMQSVSFNPGESKSFKMKFYYKGTINRLIQTLNTSGITSQTYSYGTRYVKCIGECMLFALEKRLKNDSALPINVSYHVDHYVGSRIVKIRRSPMQRDFGQVKFDNDPA